MMKRIAIFRFLVANKSVLLVIIVIANALGLERSTANWVNNGFDFNFDA